MGTLFTKIRTRLLASFMLIAIVAGISGVVSVVMVNRLGNISEEVGAGLAPLADAAMEIKLTATEAHLLIEEILSGDEGEDINRVWELLGQTLWYANAILDGGENSEGTFRPSTDPAV